MVRMPKHTYARHTAESLKNVIAQLEHAIGGLQTLIENMGDRSVEALDIYGQAEMVRGLQRIEVFIENGRHAFREFLRDRGDFGQPGGAEPAEPKRKAAKKNRG